VTNKYPGPCATCNQYVEAGAGAASRAASSSAGGWSPGLKG